MFKIKALELGAIYTVDQEDFEREMCLAANFMDTEIGFTVDEARMALLLAYLGEETDVLSTVIRRDGTTTPVTVQYIAK